MSESELESGLTASKVVPSGVMAIAELDRFGTPLDGSVAVGALRTPACIDQRSTSGKVAETASSILRLPVPSMVVLRSASGQPIVGAQVE
jgi:hypothetical protein